MPSIAVYNMNRQQVGEVQLSDDVFDAEVKRAVLCIRHFVSSLQIVEQVLLLSKTVLQYLAVVKNHSSRKVLVMHVRVAAELLSILVVVLLLVLSQKNTI